MNDIKFLENRGLYPYQFLTLGNRKVQELFPKFASERLLSGYPLDLFQSEEDNGEEIKAYELKNKYIVVTKKYSAILFPSLSDFESALKVKAYWRANPSPQEMVYMKVIDNKNPKERIVLNIDGTGQTYLEYRAEEAKQFLDTFVIKEQVDLGKGNVKLKDENGRVAFHRNLDVFPLQVFSSDEDFRLWYSPIFDWDGFETTSQRVWLGRNPYLDKVIDHKEELLQRLADLTSVQRENIKFGMGTHHYLHRALEKLEYNDRLVNQLFLPLAIYLGEQQIKCYGGKWKLLEAPLIKSWIPVIHFQNQDYDIGRSMYWDLLDIEREDFPSIATVLWNGKTPIPK